MPPFVSTHRITLVFADGTRFVEESDLTELMSDDTPQERKNLMGTWEAPFEDYGTPAELIATYQNCGCAVEAVLEEKGYPDNILIEAL